MKEEPENIESVDDEENNLVIDEHPNGSPQNIVQIPEVPAVDDEVIAQIELDEGWNIEMKEELIKRELEDDLGDFTDDEDDVIFLGPVPAVSSAPSSITDSFKYLNQFSQAPGLNEDDDAYNDTQMLLNDLLEPEPVAEPEPTEPVLAPPEMPTSHSDPTPSTSKDTSAALMEEIPPPISDDLVINANPLSLVEMLKEIEFDTLLSSLLELYDIDVVIAKLKEIKGISDDPHENEKKEGKKNKEKEKSDKHQVSSNKI